eukprot:964922-Amphidinium_carterae.2
MGRVPPVGLARRTPEPGDETSIQEAPSAHAPGVKAEGLAFGVGPDDFQQSLIRQAWQGLLSGQLQGAFPQAHLLRCGLGNCAPNLKPGGRRQHHGIVSHHSHIVVHGIQLRLWGVPGVSVCGAAALHGCLLDPLLPALVAALSRGAVFHVTALL